MPALPVPALPRMLPQVLPRVLLRMLCSSFALILLAGQKRTPRRGEQQGWNDNRGTDVVLERAERRSYREYRPYETERQADLPVEKFTDEKYVPRSPIGVAGTPELSRSLVGFLTFLWWQP